MDGDGQRDGGRERRTEGGRGEGRTDGGRQGGGGKPGEASGDGGEGAAGAVDMAPEARPASHGYGCFILGWVPRRARTEKDWREGWAGVLRVSSPSCVCPGCPGCVSWVEGLGLGFRVSLSQGSRLPPAPTAGVP